MESRLRRSGASPRTPMTNMQKIYLCKRELKCSNEPNTMAHLFFYSCGGRGPRPNPKKSTN